MELVDKEQIRYTIVYKTMQNRKGGRRMEEMQNQELCILLESILALLETGNVDRAKEILQNAINRMDKGSTTSAKE